MIIRHATVNDAPQILRLQKTAYLSEAELHDDFDIPPLTQTLDQLRADFSSRTVLKIIDSSEIVATGQVRFSQGTSYIGRMAVWPERQGKGIGSLLLASLETAFPQASRAELFTGEHSASNLAMYKRRGYREFKRERLGETTVVFLERDLAEYITQGKLRHE